MAPRETKNNAYAKFWGDKQRALWYVMVFFGVVNSVARANDVRVTNLPNFWLRFVIFPILITKGQQIRHFNDKSQTKVRNSLIVISVCLSELNSN